MGFVNPEQYLNILQQLLLSKDEVDFQAGLKSLGEFGFVENRHFPVILEQLLTGKPIEKVHLLPSILELICTKHSISPTIDSMVVFLHESASSFQNQYCLSSILDWLVNAHGHLKSSRDEDLLSLASAIVGVLFWMKLPLDNNLELESFYQELEEIKVFIQRLGKDCKMTCLKQFYHLTSVKLHNDYLPSPALTIVLQLLNRDLLKIFIEDAKSQGHDRILQMLEMLSGWMVILRPHLKYCIMELLDQFTKEMQVGEKSKLAAIILPKIFAPWLENLDNSMQDESGFIFRLLVCLRSLEIYHKLLEKVIEYLSNLDSTECENYIVCDEMEKLENYLKFVESYISKEDHVSNQCKVCQNYMEHLQNWKSDRRGLVCSPSIGQKLFKNLSIKSSPTPKTKKY